MNNPVRRATRADDFLNGLDVENVATKAAFCAAVCIQDVVVSQWSRDQIYSQMTQTNHKTKIICIRTTGSRQNLNRRAADILKRSVQGQDSGTA